MDSLAPEFIRLPFFLFAALSNACAPQVGDDLRRVAVRVFPSASLPHCAIEKRDKLVHPHLTRHGILVVHTIATKDGNIHERGLPLTQLRHLLADIRIH
jgi:hypothetical protein